MCLQPMVSAVLAVKVVDDTAVLVLVVGPQSVVAVCVVEMEACVVVVRRVGTGLPERSGVA